MTLPIDTLCSLPILLTGDQTAAGLVQAALGDDAPLPTNSQVQTFLRSRPELVQAWLNYSGDKRTAGGWYFSRLGDSYEVGSLTGGQRRSFINAVDACVDYILKEVAAIREA
jgi:hypothetical protein